MLASNCDAENPLAHGAADSSLYREGGGAESSSTCSVSDITKRIDERLPTSSSWPEIEPRPTSLGLIHCSIQHFPIRKRLRVSLLKAEGLAGKLKPELEIHAFCKISLQPGGKSYNSIVKRGRDVVFNQEFFFDNVSLEELNDKCLTIQAYHQSPQKLHKDIVIGNLFVPLKNFSKLRSKKEVKIIEELKYHVDPKKLGKIYISSCLETESRRLTINIIRVEDLPKGGISGPPDVCIRVHLTQNGEMQTKQSRVIRSTSHAVYKEAIMFVVQTKPTDLQDIRIVVSVHDLLRTETGDDLIGSAFLGTLAVDKSEHEQWKYTIEHPGKEAKAVHLLKPPTEIPNVHVTEATSDSE
ncbi:unnamed protein product [Thelazia callipaeda]|uniref:C2 domain-containing protein n=1 Tax=Thelazia callipaeda TaxID=103827 RepID=A0A158RCM1_THECL|nr:unnamed protein product [Thelazia callipaeda]